MSSSNELHRAWFPQTRADAAQQDGLTTIRHALVAMEGGLPLDARTAAHLIAAFRAFLYQGRSDLTSSLGLRPGKGRKCEAPLRLEHMSRRDALIKQALQRMGGNKPDTRLRLAELLGADALALPSDTPFAEPVMQARQHAGGRLKISARQIARIVADKTAYRQKRRT